MLRNLKTFASVWIPCSGIAFLYWMPLEIITMIVGLFKVPQFAAISIVNNIQFIFNDIYRSLDLACWAHVGNCLGMNLPNKAKSYAWISLLLAYSASLITTILILILKDYVMLAFTSDVEITKALNSIYFIFLISFAWNWGSFVLSIILDVWGYRMLLMFLVWVMYWLIWPPFAYLITFLLNFGFVGLYAVYTSAVLIDWIIQALVIVWIDWRGTAETASKRIEYEHND